MERGREPRRKIERGVGGSVSQSRETETERREEEKKGLGEGRVGRQIQRQGERGGASPAS